ncbi:hypothetical protein [Streptomyces sp. NPDC054865]
MPGRILDDPGDALDLTTIDTIQLCDRRRGIGADDVPRLVRCTATPQAFAMADRAEWFMDYRHSYGSLGAMCGNGARVLAPYLTATGRHESGPLTFATRPEYATSTCPPAVRAVTLAGWWPALLCPPCHLVGFGQGAGRGTLAECGGRVVSKLIVYPPDESGWRRVRYDGAAIGVAHRPSDTRVFLAAAGLQDVEDVDLTDPAFVEWRDAAFRPGARYRPNQFLKLRSEPALPRHSVRCPSLGTGERHQLPPRQRQTLAAGRAGLQALRRLLPAPR